MSQIRLILLLLLVGQPSCCSAQSDLQTAKREIQAEYEGIDQGIRDRNIDAAMSHFVPKGKNYRDTKANWAKDFQRVEPNSSVHAEIQAIELKGDRAVVVAHVKWSGREVEPGKKWGTKGKIHTFSADFREKDTWVKNPQGWRLERGSTLPGGKFLQDGKEPARKK